MALNKDRAGILHGTEGQIVSVVKPEAKARKMVVVQFENQVE